MLGVKRYYLILEFKHLVKKKVVCNSGNKPPNTFTCKTITAGGGGLGSKGVPRTPH